MDPFIGEIRIFCFYFAPQNWAYCDGSVLPSAQYQSLFKIIGTTYDPAGRNMVLPDMRGRMPMHYGPGPGLTPRNLGDKSGTATVTLTTDQLPQHQHQVCAAADVSDSTAPSQNAKIGYTTPFKLFNTAGNPTAVLSKYVLSPYGTSSPLGHENRQPYLAVNYCICLISDYNPDPTV